MARSQCPTLLQNTPNNIGGAGRLQIGALQDCRFVFRKYVSAEERLMSNQQFNSTLLVVVSLLLGLAVLYLRFQLYLARRDIHVLRRGMIPELTDLEDGSGCLSFLLTLLTLLGTLLLLLYLGS
jgi:hypothetical protein